MNVHEKIETEKLKMFDTMQNNNEKNKKFENLKQAIGKIISIDIAEIKLDENIRKKVDLENSEFKDLKNSIASEGVLQPVIVELRETVNNDDYELIAVSGHRRILACKELKIEKIKAELKHYGNPSKRTEHALIENLMREDLHALDIAEGYVSLLEQGWKEESISERFSKDKKYVKNIIKVGRWPNSAKNLVRKHSKIFSMRTLCNKFAKQRWETDEALLSALKEYCGIFNETLPAQNQNEKKISKITNKLNEFFMKNNLSEQDKSLIKNVLQYIGVKSEII